jgi:hypothetical protein
MAFDPITGSFTVDSPCGGTQGPSFTATGSSSYVSTAGSFAQVSLVWNGSRWIAVVFPLSTTSPCSPFKVFLQVEPDLDEPRGKYEGSDANQNPDPSLGVAWLQSN